MQNSCTRPMLWLFAKPMPTVLFPPVEPVLPGVFLDPDTNLWQQKRYQQGQTLVRKGDSSVITRAHSRKGRDLSETTASGQCVIGMEVLQLISAVQMMSLRTETSTNSLHPPYIWPSSVYATQEAQSFSLECKILYYSLRNIWCAWIQVVLLAFQHSNNA